ncbi:MAG: ribonuclease P protein component [Candidatus Liptonbacteria bacterium]|nr:ribonuclease P protein component [Candidatus Liptonbacteria bacterium]
MLAKKYRLPIQYFYKKPGKVVRNNFFVIKIMGSALNFSRFGVVVGNKINKKAPKRNSLKRKVYEFIRIAGKGLEPGKDVIITILPAVNDLTKKDLQKEASNILKFLK